MKSSRYATSMPVVRESALAAPALPDHCEVPNCDTLYVGRNALGTELHKCGKADLILKDFSGVPRGICASHYLKAVVADGKHSNQDLVDYEGRIDISKARDLQRELAESGRDYAQHPRVVHA